MVPHAVADPTPAAADPAPVGRRERRVAETRRAIVQAARELFDEQGYNDTTVDQIADRADVATRTLFRYFPSKEALLFSSFDDWRHQLVDELHRRPADEPPLCSVAIVLAELVHVAEELRPQIERAMRLAEEHEAVAAYHRGVLKAESTDAVARFIAERLRVAVDDDPRPETWAALMMASFGTSMRRHDSQHHHPGHPGQTLAALMADTAQALAAAAATLRASGGAQGSG